MSNAKIVWRERCWKRREVGGLKFQLMTNNESVFVSAESHPNCTFADFCLGLILHLKRFLFSPSSPFFLPSFSSTLWEFFLPYQVYKRKVDCFQIPCSPGIFAFHSMAQNRGLNLANGLIFQSTKSWIKFRRFLSLKCTCCPCWANEVVIELPTRGPVLACCHW